jgi:hypothetical protein
LFGEHVLENIVPESKVGAPNSQQYTLLPPKNIFFISIEEFEHLCGCVRLGEIDLISLLNPAKIVLFSESKTAAGPGCRSSIR